MAKIIKKSKKKRDKVVQVRLTPNRKKLFDLAQFETRIDNKSQLIDKALAALIIHAKVQKQKQRELTAMDLTDVDKLLKNLEGGK